MIILTKAKNILTRITTDSFSPVFRSYPVNLVRRQPFAHFCIVKLLITRKNLKMEVITIQSEAFNAIVEKIEAVNKKLETKEKEPKEKWLDNQELMQLLKISKRTAQHYRDSGLISFSQVGAKIYYRLSDVETLLNKHYNKAFKK